MVIGGGGGGGKERSIKFINQNRWNKPEGRRMLQPSIFEVEFCARFPEPVAGQDERR